MAQACLPSTQSTQQAQCNPVICMFAKRTLTENENRLVVALVGLAICIALPTFAEKTRQIRNYARD